MFLSHLITEYDMTRHSAAPAAMNHDNNTNKHYTLPHYTLHNRLDYLCDQITKWFSLPHLLSNDNQRLYFFIPKNSTNRSSSEDLLVVFRIVCTIGQLVSLCYVNKLLGKWFQHSVSHESTQYTIHLGIKANERVFYFHFQSQRCLEMWLQDWMFDICLLKRQFRKDLLILLNLKTLFKFSSQIQMLWH